MAKKILTIIIMFMLFCQLGINAENVKTPKIVFRYSAGSAENEFFLKVLVCDISCEGLSFNITYNSNDVMPIYTDSNEFIKPDEFKDKITDLTTTVDIENSVISLKNIVNSEALTEREILIYSLPFKRISENKITFSLTDTESLPMGIEINTQDDLIAYFVCFEFPADIGSTYLNPIVLKDEDGERRYLKEQKDKAVKQRAKKTIFLGINNYASVSHDALKWIDRYDKTVVPFIDKNETIMLPLRFLAENVSAEVLYDNETKEITLIHNDKTIVLLEGNDFYILNGEQVGLLKPLTIVEGRSFVAPDLIESIFELNSFYIEKDKTVVLTYKTDVDWNIDDEVDKALYSSVRLLMSALVRDLAY